MAITFFDQASNPADNGNQVGPGPLAVTPPASMAANDYVIMIALVRTTSETLSISQAGGQSWTSETNLSTAGIGTSCVFRCKFNGTWTADPSVTAVSAVTTMSVWMLVFRGVDTSTPLDVAAANTTYAAPSTPFDVVAPAITTNTANAMAVYFWTSNDDNDWTVQTGGWSAPTPPQIGNIGGLDTSIAAAYQVIASPGSTGTVTNRQVLNGGDLGQIWTLALKEASGAGSFSQSVDGTMTSSGSMLKQTARALAGTVVSSGTVAMLKAALKSLTGALASVGSLARQVGKVLSGTVPSSGATTKRTSKTFAGNLTTAGALAALRTILKSISGVLTTSGALFRQTRKVPSGVLVSAGTLARTTGKLLAGVVSSAGALSASLSGTLADLIDFILSRLIGLKRSTMVNVSMTRSSMVGISLQA